MTNDLDISVTRNVYADREVIIDSVLAERHRDQLDDLEQKLPHRVIDKRRSILEPYGSGGQSLSSGAKH